MKKILVIVLALVFLAPFLQSCTKSCTCEDPNGKVKEVEVETSEKCNKRSDSNWTCS